MADEPLLVVEDVHGYYGTAHVLEGVSFSMGAEPVALIGRNGMGKSTLCAALVGLLGHATGSVRLEGQELLGRPAYKIAGAGIGFVPQGRRLFQSLTVDEHLQIVGAKSSDGLDAEARLRAVPAARPSARRSAARRCRAASSRCSRSAARC